ncbi:hypothetical protein SLEP1_g9774 [Rubroshorea leprosula]|uniref:QWRF motif-containing protein 3 n=1 Tax=Rubroshorea leprosula TaxID=152421 RepID=A0AAV5IGZ2_9ROSI|nr:hypothetical protein SLEP1_g9774 [Rubroshorea leprosula]
MKNEAEAMVSDQSLRPRKPKSREVSSRFLSPSTIAPDMGTLSPNKFYSPSRRKSTSVDTRKHWSLEDAGLSVGGLWPSSSLSTKQETLADHLGNERLNDLLERRTRDKSENHGVSSLSRQRSCSDRFNKFESEKEIAKENHRPSLIGGSMRYTGRLGFPRKSSPSPTSSSSSSNSTVQSSTILPGRYSVDENELYKKSSVPRSEPFILNLDSESEISSEMCSTAAKNPSPVSKKSGMEVSSKYLQPTRYRRGTSNSNIISPVSADYSPKAKKFTMKNAMKRANSLAGYGSATSQWALSPGRSGSPPMSVESKTVPITFSSLKPPSSPSRSKGMEKLLNLFKVKKSSSLLGGSGDVESVHRLRLMHNRLIQWQYANARANAVNANMVNQSESNLLCAWSSLVILQHSVLYKKLQLQKENLEMKLDLILQSQIKPLEAWAEMERQHLTAISRTKECLHNVVCRVPLSDGAKIDMQSASIVLRHALEFTGSIKSELAAFSRLIENNASFLSELARVATQEKLLLEECLELFRSISILEIEERSLRCEVMQLNLRQRQLLEQQ